MDPDYSTFELIPDSTRKFTGNPGTGDLQVATPHDADLSKSADEMLVFE